MIDAAVLDPNLRRCIPKHNLGSSAFPIRSEQQELKSLIYFACVKSGLCMYVCCQEHIAVDAPCRSFGRCAVAVDAGLRCSRKHVAMFSLNSL